MYAEPTRVLMASWTVDDVAVALRGLVERAVVVVQQTGPDDERYFALDVGSVLAIIDQAAPGDDLETALDLGQFAANRVVQLQNLQRNGVPRPGDIVLQDVDVVGILRTDAVGKTTRGYGAEGLPEPAVTVVPSWSGVTRRRFRAFAALEAPDAVMVGQQFKLAAGFSDQSTADDEQPIIVPGAPEELTFVVQVAGFGFTFPKGIRRELTVRRDDPTGVTVDFDVIPAEVRKRATRTLEVFYEFDGERCGQAWHDLVVTKAAVEVGDSAGRTSGGTGVALSVGGTPPSLTVEIRSEPGKPELEWIFHTRPQVPRPDAPVRIPLEQPSAQAFAELLMARVPAASGSALQPSVMRGLGKLINGLIPSDFWAAIEATWRSTAEGETPSLLIITNDPYIPWELAWVDSDSIDSSLLSNGTEAALGALWHVGRWVPPTRFPRGPDRPAVPPPAAIDVDALAVVIGDFSRDSQVRELPYAVEEGREIAQEYDALPLTVGIDDVGMLMDAELQRDNAAFTPQAVHFASHGETDLYHQQNTGVILSEGRRLDILAVHGSRLGGSSAPFVFLNACQVGTASSILSSYGGLAGAFLGTGCRGFLAPLWNVDDQAAKDLALRFYQLTLRDGMSVGEALRQIRAGVGDGNQATATSLAYVFYGHPELHMNWYKRLKQEGH